MKLLVKETCRLLPTIHEAGNQDDPPVWLKFFTPDAGWTWYVIGADVLYSLEDGSEEPFGLTFKEAESRFGWPEHIGGVYQEGGKRYKLLDIHFTGFVKGLEDECGDFALSELLGVRGKLGLPIERDRWWDTQPLSKVMAGQTN